MPRTGKYQEPKALIGSSPRLLVLWSVFYSPQSPAPERKFRRQNKRRTARRSTPNAVGDRESMEAANAYRRPTQQAPPSNFQKSIAGDSREKEKKTISARRIRRES